MIWQTLGPPSSSVRVPPPYGGTDSGAEFPLKKPDLDLAPSKPSGISLEAVLNGWSRAVDGTWQPFLPTRVSNTPPNSCSAPSNPCPQDVFFGRLVNVVAHETAHGFGITSRRPYFLHGRPATSAITNAVGNDIDLLGHYFEDPNPDLGVSQYHEPIWGPLDGGLGFGQLSFQSNTWLMQWGMFRWKNQVIDVGLSYDDPNNWLVFDRPLRFSLTSDYPAPRTDQSLEQFFKERVPLCAFANRGCR
jgi:hypothetical protein